MNCSCVFLWTDIKVVLVEMRSFCEAQVGLELFLPSWPDISWHLHLLVLLVETVCLVLLARQ